MIIFDNYNVTDKIISEFFEIPQKDLTDIDVEEYYNIIGDNLSYELTNLDNSFAYIVEATRHTNYPEFYKDNAKMYIVLDELTKLTKYLQDYAVINYDKKHHKLTATTIGHDNNYHLIVRALTKQGLKMYDKNEHDYKLYKKLFDKYSKGVK